MALMNCTECGNSVSDKAFACPKCGALIENMVIRNSVHPNRKGFSFRIIIPVVLLLLIGMVALMLNINPNAIPGVKLEINTPKPSVVKSKADNNKSGLLKLRTTVYATIQNYGGEGNVLVTFHVYQDGNDYDTTKSIAMRTNESISLDVTFDEVKYLGGDISYHVEAVAQ